MPLSPAETSRPSSLRLSLKPDFEVVRPAALKVRDFLTTQKWSEDDIMAVELVVAEACNNAIEHASREGRTKPVEMEVLCDPERVELRVTDHTDGFQWPDQIVLPESESEGGRGLFIITLMMDHVKYFRGPGENVLVMQKERSQPLEEPRPGTSPSSDGTAGPEDQDIVNQLLDELSSCYESLSAIFRYSTELASRPDLTEFARRLLDDLCKIVSADWYVLRLLPKGESTLNVLCASESELELPPLIIPETLASLDAVEVESVITRQQVWFDEERPLSEPDPLATVKPDCQGLVHPVFLGESLLGTLAVGKSSSRIPTIGHARQVFTAGDANVVGTFADYLAIQIVNTRLHEEQLSNRLTAHELGIARSIQQSLLPKSLPQLSGFTLAGYCESARQVGGDFYDVIKVSGSSLLLVIADVMGKGVPAAMFAVVLRTLLRAAPELNADPAALLGRVNKLLFEELSGVDMFITAQLALVDGDANRLTVAGAGHCPLLLADAEAAEVRAVSPEGMPLGVLVTNEFTNEAIPLPERWRLLMFTDGVTEGMQSDDAATSTDKLIEWFKQAAPRVEDADQLKDLLTSRLQQAPVNQLGNDDETFLVMSR